MKKRNQPQGTQQSQQNLKKWITFTYYGPTIRKIMNLFKHTNLQIAFRPTNTTYHEPTLRPSLHTTRPSAHPLNQSLSYLHRVHMSTRQGKSNLIRLSTLKPVLLIQKIFGLSICHTINGFSIVAVDMLP